MNYFRQACAQLQEDIKKLSKTSEKEAAIKCAALLTAGFIAKKFTVPTGGRIFNDKLKGLPDELRLPFERVLIEYEAKSRSTNDLLPSEAAVYSADRRIVLAMEAPDKKIIIWGIFFMNGAWQMAPYTALIMRGMENNVTITEENKPAWLDTTDTDVIPDIGMQFTPIFERVKQVPDWTRYAYADLLDEANVVLELIEALSCSNVAIKALPTRKLNKSAAKRGALPFDEYHVLTVTPHSREHTDEACIIGDRRSPREHLRRGHIRRYKSGVKVWINSVLVNAGTEGRIYKEYKVAA